MRLFLALLLGLPVLAVAESPFTTVDFTNHTSFNHQEVANNDDVLATNVTTLSNNSKESYLKDLEALEDKLQDATPEEIQKELLRLQNTKSENGEDDELVKQLVTIMANQQEVTSAELEKLAESLSE